MQFIFNLFTSYPYFDLPPDLFGWAGFVLLFALLGIMASQRSFKRVLLPRQWYLYSFLLLAAFITALFIGFHFPSSSSLSLFGLPTIYHSSAVMVFSALPIVLAGGFFGPRYALAIGVLSGILIGLWDTHSLFTILEYAWISITFSWLVNQRYRSSLFKVLQHPLAAAVFCVLLFAPLNMFGGFMSSSGGIAIRLDVALTQSWPVIVVHLLEFIAAGIIGEIILLSGLKNWTTDKITGTLPWERSLSMKFMAALLPIFVSAFFILLIGDWFAAGIAARRLMEDRLENLSNIAAETLPYFLETGQNLILNYASEDLLVPDESLENNRLADQISAIPFFTELRVLDENGNLVDSFLANGTPEAMPEELEALSLARGGARVQIFAITPAPGRKSARVVFVARIADVEGQFLGVLVGHTDLQSNPFTRAAIEAIETIERSGGEGWILDEDSRVLFHSNPGNVMDRSFGAISSSDRFYEQTIPGEAPRFIYYQLASGRAWAVVFSVPSVQVKQTALDIAIPLLFVLTLITISLIVFILYLVSQVTKHLHVLADQATQIAQGQLDHPLKVQGLDEVGQLTNAFEKMRRGLKSRLKDMNTLLRVSQGSAYNLDIRKALQPVLEAIISKNASAARAVLYETDTLDSMSKRVLSFGFGARADLYEELDQMVVDLVFNQKSMLIANCSESPLLKGHLNLPGALAVFRLQYDNADDGILWAAFENPHQFSESEINFFTTLVGQASLTVLNASLYRSAQIGRQRMEAVLNSSPDPVLVFNSDNRLLLLNPAAKEVPQLIMSDLNGSRVEEVFTDHALIEMVHQSGPVGSATKEITMADGKTFTVSIAEVKASNREVGKICLLRDVSRYKNLDTIKSEFVSTVSHDLQSPLSSMRGYIRMLDLVGETNQQQKHITKKMSESIKQMNDLVDNILSLGRIETDEGIHLSSINIIEIVEKISARLGQQALQKNIQLIISESIDTGVTMRTDGMLLTQALLNLVENGIKYTPNGGRVEISTRFKDESVVFEVKDNGFGIAPLDVEYIFEKNYRVGQRAAFRQKGTGLGLSIVQSIAKRLEGKVWVDSKLGKGSTFFFELPYEPGNG